MKIIGNIKPEDDYTHELGPEENFNESWAEAFAELRRLEVCMIGYVLTKYENGFEESVGNTVVLYAEDSQTEKTITDVMFQMELDVVHTGEMGVKHARGIAPSFFGIDRFTELLVSDLKDIKIVKSHSIASTL